MGFIILRYILNTNNIHTYIHTYIQGKEGLVTDNGVQQTEKKGVPNKNELDIEGVPWSTEIRKCFKHPSKIQGGTGIGQREKTFFC